MLTICAADATTGAPASATDLIDLTVNEIRRLLNTPLIQPVRDLAHRLRWSQWRRRHQAQARRAHYARRLSAQLQP